MWPFFAYKDGNDKGYNHGRQGNSMWAYPTDHCYLSHMDADTATFKSFYQQLLVTVLISGHRFLLSPK